MVYEDGRVYRGQFMNDQKHGQGVYQWPNGKKMEGTWANGKQDGQARFTNSKGESRVGIWENGQRKKWLTGSNNGQGNFEEATSP